MRYFVLVLLSSMLVISLLKAEEPCKGSICPDQGVVTVPLHPGMKRAKVKLDIRGGRLRILGQTEHLLEAKFPQQDEEPDPVINDKMEGDDGEVIIDGKAAISQWDVLLNPGIPTDLKVDSSAADADITLNKSSLQRIDIDSGGGSTLLRLNGEHPNLQRIGIDQRNGQIVMEMPGSYQGLEELELRTSMGDQLIHLPGAFESLEEIKIESGLGNVVLNMSEAELGSDLDIEVETRAGNLLVLFPENVSVEADVKTQIGNISAPGFVAEGEHLSYRRDSKGGAQGHTVSVEVGTRDGDIQLILPNTNSSE